MSAQSPTPPVRGRSLTRRQALRAGLGALTGLSAAALVGCGGDEDDAPVAVTAASSPASSPAAVATAVATLTVPSGTGTSAPVGPAPGGGVRAAWIRHEPADRPAARKDHALVADAEGARVYLHGGRGGSGQFDDLWAYDVAARAWTRLRPPGAAPAARFGHNVMFDAPRQRLVLFGGQAGSTFFSDTWAYDVRGNAWTQLLKEGAGPQQRYGAGAAREPGGGGYLVTHGFTSSGRFDDTWRLVLGAPAWAEVSPAQGDRPLRRCLTRLVADEPRGRVLMFGGQSNADPYLGDLWAFDTGRRRWRSLEAAGPSGRNLYTAVRREDAAALLMYGGQARDGLTDDVWLLDLETDRWQRVADEGAKPAPRAGHDAVWLRGQRAMLVFGGAGAVDLDDVWELTFA